MSAMYYVRDDASRVLGPYSSESLRRRARGGKLLPSWHISPDGKKWISAAKVHNLFTDVDDALSAGVPADKQYRSLTRKEQTALFIDHFVLNNEQFKNSLPWLQPFRVWWAKLTLPNNGFVLTEVTAAGVRHVRYDFAAGTAKEVGQKEFEQQVTTGVRQFNWFVVLCYLLGAAWAVWALKNFIWEFSLTFGTLKTVVVVGVGVAAFIYRTKRTKVFLGYSLDPSAERKLDSIRRAFASLNQSSRVWVYRLREHENDKQWKYHAGSLFTVAKQPIVLFNRPIPNVETNIRVFGLTHGHRAFYFLPEKLLVIDGGEVFHVEYAELAVSTDHLEYVEAEGNVFRDSEVIAHRPRFINRDGSPDRRFKNNHELPVVRCGILRLDVATSKLELMTTDPRAPKLFKQQLPSCGGIA